MEIEFSQVTFYDTHIDGYKKLSNVSFLVEANTITSIVVGYDTGFIDLMTLNKRPNMGSIRIGNYIIKKNNKIDNKKEISKNIGVIKYHTRNKFLNKTVLEEIQFILSNYDKSVDLKKKIEESFKIVGLNTEILDRNPNSLSSTEKNRLSFAIVLMSNPKVLIFDNFDMGLTYKEKENFKRLLHILKNKYKKTIVLLSNNMDFLKNIVDKYIVINNGNNVISCKSCYNNNIYDFTEIPQLVEFIKYVQSEGHRIDDYVDLKELIKGIYRDVA